MMRYASEEERNQKALKTIEWAHENDLFPQLAEKTGYTESVLTNIYNGKAFLGMGRDKAVIEAGKDLGHTPQP